MIAKLRKIAREAERKSFVKYEGERCFDTYRFRELCEESFIEALHEADALHIDAGELVSLFFVEFGLCDLSYKGVPTLS